MIQFSAEFRSFQPADDLTRALRLARSIGSVLRGERLWIHALDLPAGEVAHVFYTDGTAAEDFSVDALTVVFRQGGHRDGLTSCQYPRHSQLVVYPAGRVAGGTYHGRVHEFILTIPKKVRAQQDEIPLPATHLIDVWRLIMVLRAELSLETCNKVAKGLIERVLAYIEKPFSPIVTKAIQLLEKNDALRAPEMSNGLGVSASYLCRQFRKNVGVNTTHYSRLLRLNRAAGLLWGTAKPICDIATSCGFSDQPHLSRELMAIFGLSPSFFRQLAPCQRAEHIFLTKQRVVD